MKRLRRLAFGLTTAITLVAAAVAWRFSPAVAKGLLAGGAAGVLAFWLFALRVERFAAGPPEKREARVFGWSIGRLSLYAAALTWSYFQDTERMHALLAAVAGIYFIRIVLVALALTDLDIEKPPQNGR